MRVANNLHVSVRIGHEENFVTANDEVLNNFTKNSPQLPTSSGVLLAKKVQPLLVLLEPSILLGYRDLAALCCRSLRLYDPLLRLAHIILEEGLVKVSLCLNASQLGIDLLEC